MTTNPLVKLGEITSAHGIRGKVKIRSFTASSHDIASYGDLLDEAGRASYRLRFTGEAGGLLIAEIEGIDDRNQAEALRGTGLYVPREQLGDTRPDEYFIHDLIGLTVQLQGGEIFGTVIAAHDFGAGDILEIREEKSGKARMYAFTKAIFPHVSVAERRLVLNPPEVLKVREEDAETGPMS